MNVINRMYLKAAQGIQGVVEDRRGDTNFISIVIVLAIVVALAVLFSTNANNLVGDLWNKITGNVSGLG